MWFLSSFSHHHFTNTVAQHCLIWLRLVLETLFLHFFRWLMSPHYFIAVWYRELSCIYFTCLSMTHYRPVSCFACLHCYFVTKGQMTSVSDSMWVSHSPCFYDCIFFRYQLWGANLIKLFFCCPDAEEEENQPQFEPSSGSPHRMGDGLTRTQTAFCIHQVWWLTKLRSFVAVKM